jgi:elongation factor Ts
MSISAADVNQLRKMTGAGMMDCKKALTEANGDFEAAIDFLRMKGQKISANRADREAAEGAVIAKASSDNSYGVVIELNCETDFVAKNDEFVKLAHSIADLALTNKPADKDALNALTFDGVTVSERLLSEMGRIGEKIEISNYELVSSASVAAYIHAGNKIGVLVAMNQSPSQAILEAGRDAAMQVAAMFPVSVDKEDVPSKVIERELEIGREQARSEGKPEAMIEKIAQGKLNKFFKDSTLINQDFVKDGSKTVGKMLDDVSKGLKILTFKRVALGS